MLSIELFFLQLLNSKKYNVDQRKMNADIFLNDTKSSLDTINTEFTKISQKRNQNDNEKNDMKNIIERVHNIIDRQERSHRRQKIEKNDNADKLETNCQKKRKKNRFQFCLSLLSVTSVCHFRMRDFRRISFIVIQKFE